MKKLAVLLLTIFAVSLTSASYAVNFFDSTNLQDNDSVVINLTFDAGTIWNLSIVNSDNDGAQLDVTSIDTTGLTAMGDDYKVVGVAYLKAQASGTWEIVTYTDNFNDLSIALPTGYSLMDNDSKNNWYGTIGGLKHAVYPLYLPIKIRSQGIEGIAEDDNDSLRAAGDTIPAAYCANDTYAENYGYIPEVEPENLALVINTEAGPAVAGTKVVAQIGLTPKSTLDRNPQVAFGIEEGMAGSGNYSTTVYFDLRGN